jgi:hypothetical protein
VNKKEAKKTSLVSCGTASAAPWESKFFCFFFVHKKEDSSLNHKNQKQFLTRRGRAPNMQANEL